MPIITDPEAIEVELTSKTYKVTSQPKYTVNDLHAFLREEWTLFELEFAILNRFNLEHLKGR